MAWPEPQPTFTPESRTPRAPDAAAPDRRPAEATRRWTTVVLTAAREPRFAPFCHRCGDARAERTAPWRVVRVGRATLDGDVRSAVRDVDVPVCRRCPPRAVTTIVVVAVAAPLPLAVGIARAGALVLPPLVVLPVAARVLVFVAWCAALTWFVRARHRSEFDVAYDGTAMRFSFRDRGRAVAFATANGGTIDGAQADEPFVPTNTGGDEYVGAIDVDGD